MDYGQTDKNDVDRRFLPMENEEIQEVGGVFEEEDQNPEVSERPENVISPDFQKIGNRVNSLEIPEEEEVEPGQRLGEIVDVSLPPGVELESDSPEQERKPSFNPKVIRTANRLSSAAIKEMDSAIIGRVEENVADFYDDARAAMEANVGNSYGREIGGSNEKKEAA